MTCIVGMYCENSKKAIIVADSREMLGADYGKTQKIFKFYDIAFSSSGLSGISTQLIEGVETLISRNPQILEQDLLLIIEDVVSSISSRYKNPDKPRFNPNEILINSIIGKYVNEKPKLYCLHDFGWAEPFLRGFRAIGDGDRYANQILTQLYKDDISLNHALEICVHAIVQISKLDSVVDDNPQIIILENNEIKLMNQDGDKFIIEPSEVKKIKEKINGIAEIQSEVFKIMLSDDTKLKKKLNNIIRS